MKMIMDNPVKHLIKESSGEWVETHEAMYNAFPTDRRKREFLWIFYDELSGKENTEFKIYAKDFDEAFDKAYDTYGPLIHSMLYEQVQQL